MTVRVAIIGTAGRKEDAPRLNKEMFEFMVQQARYLLRDAPGVTLVSGGAAWADHVAVRLFLESIAEDEHFELDLYLPCILHLDPKKPAAAIECRREARVMNYYHRQFSQAIGCDSLEEIRMAYHLGAKVSIESTSFSSRNRKVATSCDFMIAFTFGEGGIPKAQSGTAHTWSLFPGPKEKRTHVSLLPAWLESQKAVKARTGDDNRELVATSGTRRIPFKPTS